MVGGPALLGPHISKKNSWQIFFKFEVALVYEHKEEIRNFYLHLIYLKKDCWLYKTNVSFLIKSQKFIQIQ